MVPWWSSNPSTLSSSMESIENSGEHRQVQPVQPAPAVDGIDGGVVVVGNGTVEGNHVPRSTAVLAQSVNGIFGSEQHQQIRLESYEEAKRLLVFAGLFFLVMSAFVLIKFQYFLVAIDDVFRWSPAVWLIGVIICALLMNLSVQIRRFMQRIKENRIRERQNLLFSLNLSNSFSNLSPSQLHEHFCWRHRQRFYNTNVPPTYEQSDRYLLASPPAFVVCANANTQLQQQRNKVAPPKYKAVADAHSNRSSRSSSEEDISPPSYEQCQNGVP